MAKRILIKGGTVLTLSKEVPNFDKADVLVADGVIEEVGENVRARDAEVIDASETIVMPGFVDTHRHLWKTLFRNSGESVESGGGSSAASVYGSRFEPEDVYAATLIGLLGAAEAGITTVVDWADLPPGLSYAESALQAHTDSGLRTVLALASPDRASAAVDVLQHLRSSRATGDRTLLALGARDPTRALDAVEEEWGGAREIGARVHAHAGTDPAAGGVIGGLGARGILGEDVTLVHCSHLDGADLDAIANSGAQVSLAPSSEMAIGLGAPPIQGLIDRGIRPGLAVDQEALSPGDIFAAMRATNSVQHATLFDLKLSGKGGIPNLLTTRDVIRYATVDGARVAGVGAVAGSLEPGKQADVLVLRTDRPNIHPVNDPIGAVVWGMDTSNVDWVLVGGHAVVRHGELVNGTDRARELAVASRERLSAHTRGGGRG